MNSIRVNFSDVKSFETLSPGVYPAILRTAEFTQKDESKAPNVKWTFEITGGEHDRHQVSSWTSTAESSAWRLKDMLIGLGESADALTADFDLDPKKYENTLVDVELDTEPYKGKTVNRVVAVYPRKSDSFR